MNHNPYENSWKFLAANLNLYFNEKLPYFFVGVVVHFESNKNLKQQWH
jgi:hypothetical protein